MSSYCEMVDSERDMRFASEFRPKLNGLEADTVSEMEGSFLRDAGSGVSAGSGTGEGLPGTSLPGMWTEWVVGRGGRKRSTAWAWEG